MAFFTNGVRPPFDGYPQTRLRKDWRGREWYVVDIRYLSPLGAKAADNLGVLFGIGLLCAAIFHLSEDKTASGWAWAAALILPFALAGLWQHMFRWVLRSHARVSLSKDLIRIGGKTYDRHLVRGFAFRHHPYAATEHRLVTHRQQRMRSARPLPLYYGQETGIVACVLTGGAHNICTVFGPKQHNEILIRLNGINDALNGDLGVGIGAPISAGADTPAGRGGIPL